MDKEKIFDPELDEMLAALSRDEMSEARAANTPQEQIEHLAVVKEATLLRKEISCNTEDNTPDEETSWLKRKDTNGQFIKDCLGILAVPVFGLIGVVVGNKIQSSTQLKIAEANNAARERQLKQLMHYEETDSLSKHELDIINGLNK